ncbi:MAG: hypothetical protein R3F60_12390 [bacterium]
MVTAGGESGGVLWWPPGDERSPVQLAALPEKRRVIGVAVSPGGRSIAAALDVAPPASGSPASAPPTPAGGVAVWTIPVDGAASLPPLLLANGSGGHTDRVYDVAFLGEEAVVSVSRDGQALITHLPEGPIEALPALPTRARAVATRGPDLIGLGLRDGTALIYRRTPGRWVRDDDVHRHEGAVVDLDFDATGARLATVSEDRGVRLWDLSGATPPVLLGRTPNPAATITWAPGGAIVATGGRDGTIQIWRTQSPGEPPAEIQTDLLKPAYRLAFSPDGGQLAVPLAASPVGGGARLYTTDPLRLAGRLCAAADRGLTSVEWRAAVGEGEPWRPTCAARVPADRRAGGP